MKAATSPRRACRTDDTTVVRPVALYHFLPGSGVACRAQPNVISYVSKFTTGGRSGRRRTADAASQSGIVGLWPRHSAMPSQPALQAGCRGDDWVPRCSPRRAVGGISRRPPVATDRTEIRQGGAAGRDLGGPGCPSGTPRHGGDRVRLTVRGVSVHQVQGRNRSQVIRLPLSAPR